MNRSYLFLITLLAIIAVAIGAFAFYKTLASKPAAPATPPPPPPPPLPPPPPAQRLPPAPPPTQEVTPSADISSSKNPLPLTIASPQDNSVVTTPRITVSGTTAPGADVSVNEKDLLANSAGKFTTTLTLEEGQNYILATAASETGFAAWEGTIAYEPPT